ARSLRGRRVRGASERHRDSGSARPRLEPGAPDADSDVIEMQAQPVSDARAAIDPRLPDLEARMTSPGQFERLARRSALGDFPTPRMSQHESAYVQGDPPADRGRDSEQLGVSRSQ